MPFSLSLDKASQQRRSSIAAEVIALLEQFVPTPAELRRRMRAYEELRKVQASTPPGPGPFQSAEEMIREDRAR